MLNIVLYEPEIPTNTGNIMRTCVATNTRLHLIEPLGFSLDEKSIKRSGVNYIDKLEYYVYKNFDDFKNKNVLSNNQQIVNNMGNQETNQYKVNEIDQIIKDTTFLMNSMKVISKKVDITTKVTYTYEDGSTRVVTQNETHEFKG